MTLPPSIHTTLLQALSLAHRRAATQRAQRLAHLLGTIGLLALTQAAVLAAPARFDYRDVGRGDFGAMAWATAGGSPLVTRDWSGSPYALLGAAADSASIGSHSFSASASSFLYDGSLHADAYAGLCNDLSNDPRQRCLHNPRAYTSSGAALWDTVWIVGPMGTTISPRLHVDGVAAGSGRAVVRGYAGLISDPKAYLDRQTSAGFKALGPGTTDITIDLDELQAGFSSGVHIFIELEATADEGVLGGFADFGNTARFVWDLPEGVTIRSASGLFMTGAPATGTLPEPASLALAGLSVLLMALTRRQRA